MHTTVEFLFGIPFDRIPIGIWNWLLMMSGVNWLTGAAILEVGKFSVHCIPSIEHSTTEIARKYKIILERWMDKSETVVFIYVNSYKSYNITTSQREIYNDCTSKPKRKVVYLHGRIRNILDSWALYVGSIHWGSAIQYAIDIWITNNKLKTQFWRIETF